MPNDKQTILSFKGKTILFNTTNIYILKHFSMRII